MKTSHAQHNILAERVAHERELRIAELAAFEHERELREVHDRHERELRMQTEAAVEKARQLQFEVYETRLDALNHAAERLDKQSAAFMPIERFEREHTTIVERHIRDFNLLNERLETEHAVTIRQDTQLAMLQAMQSNNRWMIGLGVGVLLTLATTALHIFRVI
jgi:hypothetical protein